jgi:hypothetical protein
MSRQPFDPAELTNGEQDTASSTGGAGTTNADLVAVARELEAFATAESPLPSPALTERVVAALAYEPAPTPPRTFLVAIAALDLGAAGRALGANLRLALGGGAGVRVALRLEAAALLLAVLLVVAGGGAAAAVGAAAFIQAITSAPAPSPTIGLPPTAHPSALPSTAPTHHDRSPDATATAEPTESADPSESEGPGVTETPEPSESDPPEAGDDGHEGSGGSGAIRTPRPSGSPEASNDQGGDD